jgi:hypothetical protein
LLSSGYLSLFLSFALIIRLYEAIPFPSKSSFGQIRVNPNLVLMHLNPFWHECCASESDGEERDENGEGGKKRGDKFCNPKIGDERF